MCGNVHRGPVNHAPDRAELPATERGCPPTVHQGAKQLSHGTEAPHMGRAWGFWTPGLSSLHARTLWKHQPLLFSGLAG